jgi:prepilin-type N-terminal cleavage/methylation domain-containing protein
LYDSSSGAVHGGPDLNKKGGMKTRKRKRGFSLGEILVAVAITAVIAAVVIPSIGGQLNKGDVGRVSGDLTSIQNAVQQFLADVRRYPSAMASLQAKPSAATAADTGANGSGQYTATQVARWRGPYMTKDFSSSALTGFSGSFVTLFKVCNATGTCTANPAGQRYLTVLLPGLSSLEMAQIDSSMDDGVATTGMILTVATGVDTLKFLMLPIQ